MGSSVILFGWNRSIPGREKVSAGHFDEFVKYLGGLQQKGAIQAFDIMLLDAHGGDLNGFFLIRGEGARLDDRVDHPRCSCLTASRGCGGHSRRDR